MRKKFKLPSHVKIKNKVTYEIVKIPTFKDSRTMGECRFNQRQIAIKEGQSDKEMFKSMCHELLHSIAEERGIKISHKAIYQLEEAIYYVIFHNDWDV